MKEKKNNQILLLVTTLVITPFVLFILNNSLQIEFFTYHFFLATFFYWALFICASVIFSFFVNKRLFYLLLLFLSYFSFIQFYFFDLIEILSFFNSASIKYYTFFFLVALCIFLTMVSFFSIFRNFILIIIFLNITMSTTKFVYNIIETDQITFKPNKILNKSLNKKNSMLASYPNIFYIVPDTLTSPKILKDTFDIDYYHSIKKFEEKGFTVTKHNYSSYNSTHLSLAALFEMDYPVTENSPVYKKRNKFYPSIREDNPKILQYLKKNNYNFIIAPPKWGGCPVSKNYTCFVPYNDSFLSNFFQDYAISTMFNKSFIKFFLFSFDIFNTYGDTVTRY